MLHYGKHLKGYIDNVNRLIKEISNLEGKDLETIVKQSEGSLYNNAAQAWNHIFYFDAFSPHAQHLPSGNLEKQINKQWGNFENFKTALPDPFITHALYNYNEDRVMSQIHNGGFSNRPEDKVKIIFIPSYLKGDDGILNLSYYDVLIGLDATAFPSYYEPWGYTPLESIAFGVPTVTTDLSGFGLWSCPSGACPVNEKGVAVLHRTDSNYDEVASQLVETIRDLSGKTVTEIENIRKLAMKTSKQALWKYFISYYEQAYNWALKSVNKTDN